MRGRAWQITRAGLFLLFAVVLAALGPTDAALANQASSPAISENKPDTKEQQRDGEKLRERLPGLTTHRRIQLRHQHDRDRLRAEARWVAADFEVLVRSGYIPNVETDAGDARSRLRHSPAALQVVRH